MNEVKLAEAARAYVKMLDGCNDQKPQGYSQEDYTREYKTRMQLLDTMRDALMQDK